MSDESSTPHTPVSPTEPGRTGDPLALFLEQLDLERKGRKFEGGEHMWLGNEGLVRACKATGERSSLHIRTRRGQAGNELSYGEIVALSGDFYASPDELFDEAPAYLPWFPGNNNVDKLTALFKEELAGIKGGQVRYPDKNLAYWLSAKNYTELALDNTVHFGWHNVLAYCKHHAVALNYALSAYQTGDEEVWRRAIYTNGFADHFLTDAFAAGHIRVPRAQTLAWAVNNGFRKQKMLAGALSMLLHDQDGHLHTVHGEGGHVDERDALQVRNSLGDEWFTRCDGQLFIAKPSDPAVQQPLAAISASFAELLRAYRRGDVLGPNEVFPALKHVPFPHPEAKTLCEKFPATMDQADFEKLMKRVRWFSEIPWVGPGLNEEHVRAYLLALPKIMENFRNDVATTSSALLVRVPKPYIEAFRKIA